MKMKTLCGQLAALPLCFSLASPAAAQDSWAPSVSTGMEHRSMGWVTGTGQSATGSFNFNPERASWGGSVSNAAGMSASFTATPWANGSVSTGARGGFADAYYEMSHGGNAYADQYGSSANTWKRGYGQATSNGDGSATIRFGNDVNGSGSGPRPNNDGKG